MQKSLIRWLPELLLAIAALFFFFRELGTFPSTWTDDSLHMIIARQIAAGKGFSIPVLDTTWDFPVFPIGPLFFSIVALFIKLFGFSVIVARIPMTLFLIGTTIYFYLLSRSIGTRTTARWATALLISLSAFVNTGKPVMAEISAFFFLAVGLFFLARVLEQSKLEAKWAVFIGLCFGATVLMKLTFVLVLPALALAWLFLLLKKRKREWHFITIVAIVAVLTIMPWKVLEFLNNKPELIETYSNYLRGETISVPGQHVTLQLLLRFQYLYAGTLFVLGGIGIWSLRRKLHPVLSIIITGMIVLFIAYFFMREGWYRHLLLAHMLVLPFVPIGAIKLCKKQGAVLLLTFFIAVQGWWQLDHKGSRRGERGAASAEHIVQNYQDRDIIVQIAEAYVRLPENPRWRFLLNPNFIKRQRLKLAKLTPEQECMPLLTGLDAKQQKKFEGRLTNTEANFFIIDPPATCR